MLEVTPGISTGRSPTRLLHLHLKGTSKGLVEAQRSTPISASETSTRAHLAVPESLFILLGNASLEIVSANIPTEQYM